MLQELPNPAALPWRQTPGPRGIAALRTLLAVRRNRIGFVETAAHDFGDVVGFRMGVRRLFLVSSPDGARHVLSHRADAYRKGIGLLDARPLFGDGLLTSDGQTWADDRATLEPLFQRSRIESLATPIARFARGATTRWSDDDTIDVAQEMTRLALDVLDATIFHCGLSGLADRLSEDLAVISRWSMRHMTALLPLPLAVPTPRNIAATHALGRLTRVARRAIEASRADPASDGVVRCLLGTPRGAPSERRLRDHVLTLLLAGHETTAAALTWTWWLLASHPDVERRLHAELDDALGNRPVDSDDVGRLPFTRAVVEESLRLYPPVWLVPRRAAAPDVLDGHLIPEGSDVLVCTYTLHRHPKYWPNAGTFDPARFAATTAARRHPWAYLPFGGGPRACVGRHLALLEMVLAVAAIAQRVRLARTNSEAPVPEPGLTLRPARRVLMRVTHRRERPGN